MRSGIATAEPKEFLKISGGHNEGFLISGRAYVEGLNGFISKYLADRSRSYHHAIELHAAQWYNLFMRKPRAIVCDDDKTILSIFKLLLERSGYEVVCAETPVTCAFYRERSDSCPQHDRCADVLLTDYNMPDMTGLQLLEIQHRQGCKLTNRNKALMTGGENPELRKRATALGCHFFPKPLLISTFLAWLKECESRVDLSEPLAEYLFLPARKEDLVVDSGK